MPGRERCRGGEEGHGATARCMAMLRGERCKRAKETIIVFMKRCLPLPFSLSNALGRFFPAADDAPFLSSRRRLHPSRPLLGPTPTSHTQATSPWRPAAPPCPLQLPSAPGPLAAASTPTRAPPSMTPGRPLPRTNGPGPTQVWGRAASAGDRQQPWRPTSSGRQSARRRLWRPVLTQHTVPHPVRHRLR